MGTTTKGLEPQKTTTQEAANVASKGQPAQGMGPLLGAGGASISTADDAGKKSPPNEKPCGDPVNALTGDVIDDDTDFELPGVIPLAIKRNYSTAFREQPSRLGLGGWILNLEEWVEATDAGLRYREANGRFLDFASLEPGAGVYVRSKRYQIDCVAQGSYRITEVLTGLAREFSTGPGSKHARLRRIIDARSNHLDLHYDGERLVEVLDTAQRRLLFAADADGRFTELQVIAQGQSHTIVRYAYHPDGELAFVEDALGHRERYEYDGYHRLMKKTLRNGLSFHYRYETDTGKCVKTWGDGGLHEYEFIRERKDDHIVVTTIGTDEPRVTKFNFAGDLLEEATFDRSFVERKTYDADHYLLSETNAAGETTNYEYDERGNRIRITDPAGSCTTIEYEGDHVRQLVTADGLTTTYRCDAFGEIAGLRYPTGAEYTFDYDNYGRMASIFGPDGTIARFGYDEFHNLVEEADARGATFQYISDSLGRPVERINPIGAKTHAEYDALGRPVRISFPNGSVTEFTYDALGNVVRYVDAQGQVTDMQYQGSGRLASQRMPDGTAWRFEYDKMERLCAVQNPKSERYSFFYDRVGRVEREETFDQRVLQYTYENSGRLLKVDQPDGTFRRFTYDLAGNIVQEDTPHGPRKYERDVVGRLTSATIVDGPEEIIVAFERDDCGRIVRERQGQHVLEYAYDSQGRRTGRVVPWCGVTKYTIDAAGGVTRIEHDSTIGAKQDLHLDRDLLGRQIALYSADGKLRIDQAHDSMDRLIEQKISAPQSSGRAAQTLLSQRQWHYDLAGRVTNLVDSRWGTSIYEYDSLGQLRSAKRNRLHEVFEYQANGSLRRAVNALEPETSVEGASPWDIGTGNLLRRTERHEYEYDRCHRRVAKTDHLTKTRTEYVWDCRDRLREVKLPDGRVARYFYDAFGRRVRKEVTPNPAATIAKLNALSAPVADEEQASADTLNPDNAFGESLTETLDKLAAIGQEVTPKVTFFLWDGDTLASELDSEHGPRGHVHYPGTFVPLMQVERGEILIVVTDHLGTPRDLLSGDGTPCWSAVLTAWGRVHEEAAMDALSPLANIRSPFRFLGQYYDEETGLSATRYRMWDADTGRWCSPDPLGIYGGENLHGLNGCPSVDSDPYGLKICQTAADKLAEKYAEAVKTNKPWSWKDLTTRKLTRADKQLIRDTAANKGLIPKITVDQNGVADFSGVAVRTETLPPGLYKATDSRQFTYLDNLIGGRPDGMTWHHSMDTGKMQLVPFGVHNAYGHSGGRSEGQWADAPR